MPCVCLRHLLSYPTPGSCSWHLGVLHNVLLCPLYLLQAGTWTWGPDVSQVQVCSAGILRAQNQRQPAEQCECVCEGVRVCTRMGMSAYGLFSSPWATSQKPLPSSGHSSSQAYKAASKRTRSKQEVPPSGSRSPGCRLRHAFCSGDVCTPLLPPASFCCPYFDLGSSLSGSLTV